MIIYIVKDQKEIKAVFQDKAMAEGYKEKLSLWSPRTIYTIEEHEVISEDLST